MTNVSGLAPLDPRSGEPGDGTGLNPAPGEGVDVLAVAIAPGPSSEPAQEGAGDGARPVPEPRRGAVEAAVRYGIDVASRADAAGISGKAGEHLVVEPPRGKADLPGKLIYLGVGDESHQSLRRAGACLARATFGVQRIRTSVVDGLPLQAQQAFLEGFFLGGYRAPKTGVSAAAKPMAVNLEVTGLNPQALVRAETAARAAWLARDLTNTPPDIATPAWMAEQSRAVAEASGLEYEEWNPVRLAAEGFGGLMAVGSGSSHGPRLVCVTYRPGTTAAATAGKASKPGKAGGVVLVGKGITFDSGGISLKPRESMPAMKMDMAGSAVVLSVVQAAAELGLPFEVTGLLALAENAIGASSYRPGDVVRTWNGTTVEIGNTDAEGRMVLADALAYAADQLDPEVLVDVATLTGAAALGLGKRHAALFGNRSDLLSAFEAAGSSSGEPLWQLPLVPDYDYLLESDTADLAHVAPVGAKAGGGAILAALFLEKFVGETPWIHLDIAGPMEVGSDTNEYSKGATGFGARLLIAFLRARAARTLAGLDAS
ncbi:leucyl aminopeptidase family protein [Arthrobacter caoxuetaonis]|uniref:Probable cytosol aminopeptidase n=1 Tax=Arthrobacter caoxuetaonis TaxID=2886935 RepID=A0A9X1MBJ1_9MICC|nr:leucyl aminopeptidase family protein [Arthrobacter caoxuetaonis]MCC3296691.1 leucyl aminopeptidase family protein [Arthrobacter caoxuetaonis]USQ56484.1 leucyl aminopeptidase family protein [Arthrobacter caoxuetaonis]